MRMPEEPQLERQGVSRGGRLFGRGSTELSATRNFELKFNASVSRRSSHAPCRAFILSILFFVRCYRSRPRPGKIRRQTPRPRSRRSL